MNISGGGVFVFARGNFQKGQKATMVLNLKEADYPLKLSGQVVKVEGNGIAIEFKNVSIYLRQFIASLLNEKGGLSMD